jgi:membrane fusion protein, multidrug efflux system
MFEDNDLEMDESALEEHESPQSVLGSLHEPNGESWKEEARVLLRQESPAAKQPVSPDPEGLQSPPIGKQHRKGFLHRRPIVSAIGGMVLASALGGGYLYADYARHFQSTDDAFIAARQSALAPKVSGYLTAVPVTDNEHVATGDVIARIDDRDYRVALEQAEAQVAAAQASIENTDAQLDVQQAQISANQAQVDQAQAALVFAKQQATRYEHLEQTGYGAVQNAEQYTSQLHQQQAALQSAQATLKLAQRQIQALEAQRKSAVASLAQAQAQRDQAQLNLSYTTVTAAQPRSL